MPDQVRKQIAERMIGPWAYEVTWGNKTMTGEETTRWAGRRSAVIIEGHLTSDGRTSHYVIVRAGGARAGNGLILAEGRSAPRSCPRS